MDITEMEITEMNLLDIPEEKHPSSTAATPIQSQPSLTEDSPASSEITECEPQPPRLRASKIWRLAKIQEEEMLEENSIRREKRKQMENKKEIEMMRAKLPEYDINEIRFHKLPFYDALMLQLADTGYEETRCYIEQLFKLNEELREEAGPMSLLWTRPLLKDTVVELRHLSEALMNAEDLHVKEKFKEENECLLNLVVDFAFIFEGWYWLAKELVVQCINVSSQFKTTGKHEAMGRYIYAKMLIEKVRDYETAELHLNLVREMSTGKSWNLKQYLQDSETSNTLFMNANRLLFECYMRTAKQSVKSNWARALEYATLAKKRAIEACFYEGETRAFYLKGQCELNLGNFKEAVSTFSKAYYIQVRLKSPLGICEAYMELAKAYLMLGNTESALKNLTDLRALAQKHGFQFYLAQSYRYFGEYYLKFGLPHKASPLLAEALRIFNETGHPGEADQVRNLGALSSGLELMPVFVPLLQRTDRRCHDWYENLQKIIRWKDSREQFWEGDAGTVSEVASSNEVDQPDVDGIPELASIFQEKFVDTFQKSTQDVVMTEDL